MLHAHILVHKTVLTDAHIAVFINCIIRILLYFYSKTCTFINYFKVLLASADKLETKILLEHGKKDQTFAYFCLQNGQKCVYILSESSITEYFMANCCRVIAHTNMVT